MPALRHGVGESGAASGTSIGGLSRPHLPQSRAVQALITEVAEAQALQQRDTSLAAALSVHTSISSSRYHNPEQISYHNKDDQDGVWMDGHLDLSRMHLHLHLWGDAHLEAGILACACLTRLGGCCRGPSSGAGRCDGKLIAEAHLISSSWSTVGQLPVRALPHVKSLQAQITHSAPHVSPRLRARIRQTSTEQSKTVNQHHGSPRTRPEDSPRHWVCSVVPRLGRVNMIVSNSIRLAD